MSINTLNCDPNNFDKIFSFLSPRRNNARDATIQLRLMAMQKSSTIAIATNAEPQSSTVTATNCKCRTRRKDHNPSDNCQRHNNNKHLSYRNICSNLRHRLGSLRILSHIFVILLVLQASATPTTTHALLVVNPTGLDGVQSSSNSNSDSQNSVSNVSSSGNTASNSVGGGGGGHYLDKLDNLERSVAAVLIKVAYGTTSTTKRSIPDNSYVPSLTTIATPPLTTLRYLEKSPHHQQINLHHRNYEMDLERDHALPTSAPNADILKSNSNPTYPNPNRHHNHERDRHRHLLNSTPSPSIHNLLKKGQPTIPMYPGEMPSYSPPARSFFTPPLPPEYQNPFADKPTLRGTNNDGGVGGAGAGGLVNTGTYINRRPIPPPSLMPGHERIPFRPPDLNPNAPNVGGGGGQVPNAAAGGVSATGGGTTNIGGGTADDGQRKKALNTPSQKVNNKVDQNGYNSNGVAGRGGDLMSNVSDSSLLPNSGRVHFPSISRILSGSNGKKEDIPEVLLKQVTNRPNFHAPSPPVQREGDSKSPSQNPNINQSKSSSGSDDTDETGAVGDGRGLVIFDNTSPEQTAAAAAAAAHIEPKIKMSTKSTENPPAPAHNDDVYSTQVIHNLANINNEKSLLTTTSSSTPSAAAKEASKSSSSSSSSSATSASAAAAASTWSVAWNIHVYLSVTLFTILAVYSIFKIFCYDKLTHLFNQSYFICIHLILIIICMSRMFYLCYDAYNIHSTFHIFISEILLNLPATFLTISFSVLILFLLIKSLNHKNNRYSALIRPLTVVVGSSVHVGLCITLHYVESYTTSHSAHYLYRYHRGGAGGTASSVVNQQQQQLHHPALPPPPPRVLSLICQIIYIFICLSLGLLYLYLYRILKRVLRSKSQNYIHGYQNLSYAIHITIATALLFVLLAALQIFGAISISTTRPLMISAASEMDWLQWGYQFSLRLIEIAIITLMSWVAGLKTGGGGSGVGGVGQSGGGLGRGEKGHGGDNQNVSGFLFPCASSSSQEHFETDYPAVCNANTNLHTYTLRTGKPIYDDNFALNSLGGQSGGGQSQNFVSGGGRGAYDTGSLRSVVPHHHHHHHGGGVHGHSSADFLQDSSQTDHYENPNFELRSTGNKQQQTTLQQPALPPMLVDNCYSEPLNQQHGGAADFSNFERPNFVDRPLPKHYKSNLDRSNYENPERRSSNSTHSCASGRYPLTYNSFERRSGGAGSGVRKSGTLNNIGGMNVHGRGNGGGGGGSSSSSTSSSRPSGVQTLSSHHSRGGGGANLNSSGRMGRGDMNGPGGGGGKAYYRNHRSSLERSSSAAMQQYMLPSDDDMVVSSNAECTNLINGSGSGITSSTSGGNLTDNGGGNAQPQQPSAVSTHILNGVVGVVNGGGGGSSASSGGDSANSGSMLVAEHGFVRFRALDDINNAQGVGIHNASIRTTGRNKEKRYTNNT